MTSDETRPRHRAVDNDRDAEWCSCGQAGCRKYLTDETRPRSGGHRPDAQGICCDCFNRWPCPFVPEPADETRPDYCWPSLGEPCGNCHRCAGEPETRPDSEPSAKLAGNSPDRDALREPDAATLDRIVSAWTGWPVEEIADDDDLSDARRAARAVYAAVVEPALAQRDAEIERVWRWFETDAAALRRERDDARRRLAAVEAIINVVRARDSAKDVANTIRAALAGDQVASPTIPPPPPYQPDPKLITYIEGQTRRGEQP